MNLRIFALATIWAAGAWGQRPEAGRQALISGDLTAAVADYFSEGRSETKYFVTEKSGQTWGLELSTENAGGLQTGLKVSARGRVNGTVIENAEIVSRQPGIALPLATTLGNLPAIVSITGPQKILIYNLQTAENQSRFSDDQLDEVMFAQSGHSVNIAYSQSSFGAVQIVGEVAGPYTITAPGTCDTANIQKQADAAANSAGVNVSAYPHRVYMMPEEMAGLCKFGGVSYLGGSPGFSWINTGDYYPGNDYLIVALSHELGHQLNMNHAQAIQSDGSLSEYGNNSCLMGDAGYYLIDFHVVHRIEEGWIPLSNIQEVEQSGVYQVFSGEAQTSAIQAIQIFPPDSETPVYVTYRQPQGLDAELPSAFTAGASIDFWSGGSAKTQLATWYPWGGALSDGQTWISSNGALRVTQIAHTSSSVTLDIRLLHVISRRR